MVERVKRAATARQMQLDKAMRDAQGDAKQSPRGLGHSSRSLGATGRGDEDGRSQGGGSRRGPPSIADSHAESGLLGSSGRGGTASQQVREIEHKAFWYQDAIHEQELQQQLLEAKIKGLHEEVQQVLNSRNNSPELKECRRGERGEGAEQAAAAREEPPFAHAPRFPRSASPTPSV